MTLSFLQTFHWSNALSLGWFLLCWVGYSYFAHYMAKRSHSLSSVLHDHRVSWMKTLLNRESLVADAALISNIERQVSFFASTTILVLAGLLAVIPNISTIYQLLAQVPFFEQTSESEIQLRVMVLCCIFVYAFFTFTWAMRQFGFSSVLMGAAPLRKDEAISEQHRNQYARYTAKLIDQASHTYNYGLRAYYFAMAIFPWFISQWLFMGATALVVAVLYHREFHSKPLVTLRALAKMNKD
ncbi:DUF599 domain-containing protein [Dasania marina]|uniref:DUF599 domain-containing protein n=1 Tax=Dasania marina TaxID=471499 RepID=UPI00037D3987|nr:DUF599 domain-containing protein [Dasania marina]